MQPLALGAEALASWVPQEKGAKKEKGNVLELSNNRRIRRSGPGATASAQQRHEVHRSFGRHAPILEEHTGRMVLEDRMAPYLDLPAATRCIRLAVGRERLARPDRGKPG